MGTFGKTDESDAVNFWSLENWLIASEVTFPNLTYKQAVSISAFIQTNAAGFKVKAALYAGDDPWSFIAATPERTMQSSGATWQTFTFAEAIPLVANKKYRITIWGDLKDGIQWAKYGPDLQPFKLITHNTVYAENFPANFPGGYGVSNVDPVIYCTYEQQFVPYPIVRLKKNLISGFNCFLNAYLLAKIEGFNPLKLPDGTVF